MRKHAETFRANKGYKFAIVVLYQFLHFQNRNFWYTYQTSFARKRGLAHPYFLYENKSLHHCLSYDLRQMSTLLVLEVRFFKRFHSLRVHFFSESRVWVQFLDDAVDQRFF